jgi:aminoglycoside phosphotransferase (APT) family kinase protein
VRFAGEKFVYDRLAGEPLPLPKAVIFDSSLQHAPYPYLITTRLAGEPLIDLWPDLSPDEQYRAAYRAGELLAQLHGYTLEAFCRVGEREQAFPTWRAFVEEFYYKYAGQAEEQALLTRAELSRHERLLERFRPYLEEITTPQLLHSDYHFENILQENGEITGIIDFEHARSGDPAYEFRLYEQWEEDCPGSRAPLYAGYLSRRAFDPTFEMRASFYKSLWLLDDVVWRMEENDPEGSARSRRRLGEKLDELEARFPC